MKIKIDKQKVADTLIDIVVMSALFTFLWNLILPAAIGISTISYWEGLGIVAHVFGIWHLFKLASKEEAPDSEPVAQTIPVIADKQ